MTNLIYSISLLFTWKGILKLSFLSPIGFMTYHFTSAFLALVAAI